MSADPAAALADALRARVEPESPVLIALDFDGTLTEIRDEPDAPRLSEARRRVLAGIPHPTRRLAILSGRSLADLRSRVGIEAAICVGNHGLEMSAPGLDGWRAPAGSEVRLSALLASLPAIDGAWVEDKGLTASVHVRPRDDLDRLARVGRALSEVVERAGFALRSGKAVWEIRPAGAPTKGDALLRLIAALPGVAPERTVYIGDDTTDEDAFAAIPEGITALVGPVGGAAASASRARWRLPDPPAVYRFLEGLVDPR